MVYFSNLQSLGWVENTGKTEPSAIPDAYPRAPATVFYRLTDAGMKAIKAEVSEHLMILYHDAREQRSARTRSYTRA